MTREPEPLYIADVSQFTKSLRAALAEEPSPPGHQRLMGLVARAAGFRNQQHRKAATPAPAEPGDRVARAMRVFDADGRMARWPQQTTIQALCLWVIWHHLPPREDMTEPELNAILKAWHSFGDHALLRRSLVDHKLIHRSTDGRVNRRIEQRPPDDARALLQQVLAR